MERNTLLVSNSDSSTSIALPDASRCAFTSVNQRRCRMPIASPDSRYGGFHCATKKPTLSPSAPNLTRPLAPCKVPKTSSTFSPPSLLLRAPREVLPPQPRSRKYGGQDDRLD
jgi:hypothetical protein